MKRANLSNLLLASVGLTEPGKKLADQLALMSLPATRPIPIRGLSKNQLDVLSLIYDPVPQPSSDEAAWWNGPGTILVNELINILIHGSGYPNGVVPISEFLILRERKSTNPFDSPEASSLSSSPSTSDEELYNDALGFKSPPGPVNVQHRKPPPPPPLRQPG